jgi:hypothetical protein
MFGKGRAESVPSRLEVTAPSLPETARGEYLLQLVGARVTMFPAFRVGGEIMRHEHNVVTIAALGHSADAIVEPVPVA